MDQDSKLKRLLSLLKDYLSDEDEQPEDSSFEEDPEDLDEVPEEPGEDTMDLGPDMPQEETPEQPEEDPVILQKEKRAHKYLKKYVNNPENDQVRPVSNGTRDYYWNVDVQRYYGK